MTISLTRESRYIFSKKKLSLRKHRHSISQVIENLYFPTKKSNRFRLYAWTLQKYCIVSGLESEASGKCLQLGCLQR